MTATALDPQTVVVSEMAHGSPFCGMTLAQARLMNSALAALPVEVYGGKLDKGPEVYVFGGMVLPGHWRTDPIQAIGDLNLIQAERVADCWLPRHGLSRVLSASLVKRFDVLSIEPQYRACEDCGRVLPLTEKVYDVARLSNNILWNGEFEWDHRFECRDCWFAL